MPANPWELRADVRPLDVAATRWDEVGALMTRRGDEIVGAARRATEGWDAAAAESYAQHRRQVLANLDRFTTLTAQVSGSLRAISSIVTASQKELDRAWTKVALVPHDFVGESRYLVFSPEADEDRGKVDNGRAETEEIRRRLALALDQESARIRTARAELVVVRTELTTLGGGTFGEGGTVPGIGPSIGPGVLPGIGPSVLRGIGPGGEESGVGTIMPADAASTSVAGSAQSGISASALPPVAPISVSMPHLEGLSASALAPFVATAAGLAGRKGARRTSSSAPPPVGGMGAGAMGARAGSMSRGAAGGRAGTSRLSSPRLPGQGKGQDEDGATAASRAKQAAKEAKRAALEEKRAGRAARRAEREADRAGRTDPSGRSGRPAPQDKEDEDQPDVPAIVVVEVAPGEGVPSDGAGTDHVPDAGREVDAGDVRDVRRS